MAARRSQLVTEGVSRCHVSWRQNAKRFRAAAGDVAKTHGFSAVSDQRLLEPLGYVAHAAYEEQICRADAAQIAAGALTKPRFPPTRRGSPAIAGVRDTT